MKPSPGEPGLRTVAAAVADLEQIAGQPAGRTRALAAALALGSLALAGATGGVRGEHLVANALLAALPWLGPRGLEAMRGALPLWVTGVLMDNQPLFLGVRGEIHTGSLYAAEVALFPARLDGRAVTWAEWFTAHSTPLLDVLCGLAYAFYLAWFLLVVAYLFWRRDSSFKHACWGFLLVNLMGLAIYLMYPAAPPWYVMAHGPGPADLWAAPSAAGAARFDALLGTTYFQAFYSRNPNIFGAMPSLHVAYPLLAGWFVWRRGRVWRVASAAVAVLVAFAAVYLAHHYVLDVLAGAVVGLLACAIVTIVARRMAGEGAHAR